MNLHIKKEIQHSEKFRIFNIDYLNNSSDFESFDENLFDKVAFLNKIKFFFEQRGLEVNIQNFKKINNKSLIIMIAMLCPFSINEKQALLECKNTNILANTLSALFDFEISQPTEHETIN